MSCVGPRRQVGATVSRLGLTGPSWGGTKWFMHYETCDGYKLIHTGKLDDDAPKECARLEKERNDNFAVIAIQDGKIVADAEGWHRRHDDNRVYAAQYAHAAGYPD